MIQLSVQVRNAQLVSKRFEDFTGEIKKIGEGRLYGRLVSAEKRVTTAPPRYAGVPKHHWASERQRKFVMAAIRDGRIKYPYSRTGRYQSSWRIEKIENGYRLTSNYPAAKWVAGSATNPGIQYHIHKTRWMPLRLAMEESVKELPKDIQNNITMVARRRGF